ncbi:Hypothetical_protein [Hexamita inflata]|uniref:Hypothetical_protein n=1 Tax=Hexamita inflata TaxID=28002 RepID=A0ABP1HP77_9EUKA
MTKLIIASKHFLPTKQCLNNTKQKCTIQISSHIFVRIRCDIFWQLRQFVCEHLPISSTVPGYHRLCSALCFRLVSGHFIRSGLYFSLYWDLHHEHLEFKLQIMHYQVPGRYTIL